MKSGSGLKSSVDQSSVRLNKKMVSMMVITDTASWICLCCQTHVGSKEPCRLNKEQIN